MEITYTVPGMSCGHCKTAVEQESGAWPASSSSTSISRPSSFAFAVRASDDALRAAIDEAGYDAA